MSYIYKTKGTCSTQIEVELDGNIVKNVKFTGGCQGNLQAIPRLVEGMTVEEVERRISGIPLPDYVKASPDRSVWGLFYPRTTGCNCFPSKAAEIVSGKSSIFATIEFGFFS